MTETKFNFKSLNIKNLQKRTLSAAIMIPMTLIILYFGGWPFIILLTVLCGISLYEWIKASLACETQKQYYYAAFGIAYLVCAFLCFYLIFTSFGFYWAMVFVLMIWASDIGAYFVGKFIGGPKLLPQISPNKTWAGFAGALASPALCGFICAFIYKGIDGFSFSQIALVTAIGIVIGLTGQSGDLLISTLKRQANIKDTGTIIPGHGGLLDRMDSMFLAAPFYFVLMYFFYNFA